LRSAVISDNAFRPIQHPDIAVLAAETIVNAEIFVHSADCAVGRLLELPIVFLDNLGSLIGDVRAIG
jgi:hypothetical protein